MDSISQVSLSSDEHKQTSIMEFLKVIEEKIVMFVTLNVLIF